MSEVVVPLQNLPDLAEEASFKAVIFPKNDPLLDLVENKTLHTLPSHVLCLAGEYPERISDQLQEIRISTGFRVPVKKYMTATTTNKDPIDPDMNRAILLQKSQLIYTLSETLDSTYLYWHLDEVMNETRTYRQYDLVLYYDQFICYTLNTDLLAKFSTFDSDFGMLLFSTKGISGISGARWWILECFWDVWELEMKSKHPDKKLFIGPKTGEMYITSSEIASSPEIQDLLDEITSRILGFIPLKRFPRNTPKRIIKSRSLKPLRNGQWEANSDVPSDFDLTSDLLTKLYLLNNLQELFWILFMLQASPTYKFMEPELNIEVHSNEIRLSIRTEYLFDFLRLETASRVIGRQTLGDVQIWYKEPFGPSLRFFDSLALSPAWLTSSLDLPKIPIRPEPSDLTLESRILADLN